MEQAQTSGYWDSVRESARRADPDKLKALIGEVRATGVEDSEFAEIVKQRGFTMDGERVEQPQAEGPSGPQVEQQQRKTGRK